MKLISLLLMGALTFAVAATFDASLVQTMKKAGNDWRRATEGVSIADNTWDRTRGRPASRRWFVGPELVSGEQ